MCIFKVADCYWSHNIDIPQHLGLVTDDLLSFRWIGWELQIHFEKVDRFRKRLKIFFLLDSYGRKHYPTVLIFEVYF